MAEEIHHESGVAMPTDRNPVKEMKIFHRQLVLLQEIMDLQLRCNHSLLFLNPITVVCQDCGGIWLK